MAKKNQKRKIKYNFPLLKVEFFASEYPDVMTFFERKFNAYNRHIQKQTLGWTKEKKERDKKIAERIIAEQTEETVIALKDALSNAVNYFMLKVQDGDALKKLTPKQAKIIWEVLRTENGLPTKITKNENTNYNKEDEEKAFNELDKYGEDNDNQSEAANEMEDTTGDESEEDLPF